MAGLSFNFGRAARSSNRQFLALSVSVLVLAGCGLTITAWAEEHSAKQVEKDKKSPHDAEGGAEVLPTITVTDTSGAASGETDTGFVAAESGSATGTDTPLSNIPQSVQVVTKDVMKSQQSQSVMDVLHNVSGTSRLGLNSVVVRGFEAPVMIDGQVRSGSAQSLPPAAGYARAEVLKGADSILAGRMAPGGSINLVRKRPQSEAVREVTVETGSFGHLQNSWDLTGPLTPEKELTYRLIAIGQYDANNAFGYDGAKDGYLAPSMRWTHAGTDIVIGGEFQSQRVPGTPATFIGVNGPIPLSSLMGNPADGTEEDTKTAYFDVEHEFDNEMTFHAKGQYQRLILSGRLNTLRPMAVMGVLTHPAAPLALDATQDTWNLEATLAGKADTGMLQHEILAGWRYMNNSAVTSVGMGELIFLQAPDERLPPVERLDMLQIPDEGGRDSGLFIQDQIDWNRLHLLANLTYNTAKSDSADAISVWTPNVGVAYQVTDSISVYANWQNSFQSNVGSILASGEAAPPTKGTSIESGVKLNLLDDRMMVSAAVFRASNNNSIQSNPLIPGTVVLGGGNVSRGIEFDASGELAPGWSVIGNYTLSDNEQDDDNYAGLPRHQGSLWTTYDLQDDRWHGFGGGIGVTARSGYDYHFEQVQYPVPAQAQLDASIYWKKDNASVVLGVKNVLDDRLYSRVNNLGPIVFVEPGRTVLLTGTFRF
ncbi:iron complex outermembrane recepter protein [Phyllobacterium sp. YR620]|uniref:TonB-dependent siderophore receptor n=1 Tax=Phyllobacterium sp. YR620 TaxID=1881066 RepID=UPI0008840A27|nr:TonB-dependent siderophore receptor [Phyllobacterium sp. YR620]SDP89129.1 iron complex outermembrane recepter protein [Phyllobacterium sp. YR620]